MLNHLFVYGTLGPGQSHEYLLKQVPGKWQKARIRGKLYPNGIGPARGYPALVIDSHADEIHGHVYFSRKLSRLWQQLDAYEGSAYKRVLTKVKLDDNKSITAWVYSVAETEEDRTD